MKKIKLNIQMFASTNKTTNYDLPQFVGTDKPTWLGDINEAMSDIDAGMHENATNISTMASDVATASAAASQASQDVAGLTTTVNTLSSNVSAVTTTANNAQSTATSALNTANTANGKADTNASAITTINTNVGDLSNLLTTDKTSIVNAINEIDNKEIGMTGHILWGNATGVTSGNITLDDDILDYDIIEIYGFSSDGDCVYTKIPKLLYNKKILLSGQSTDNGGNFYMKIARLDIDSTNNVISFVYNREWYKPATSQNGGYNNSGNYIHVTDVVGYKIGLFN